MHSLGFGHPATEKGQCCPIGILCCVSKYWPRVAAERLSGDARPCCSFHLFQQHRVSQLVNAPESLMTGQIEWEVGPADDQIGNEDFLAGGISRLMRRSGRCSC